MRTDQRALLLVLLGPVILSCASKSYVLPIADGGPTPSPPSVQGRITSVEVGRILINPDDAGAEGGPAVAVRLTSSTELFTDFGGLILPEELVAGRKVRIWSAQPTRPRRGDEITAAKVMTVSEDSGP